MMTRVIVTKLRDPGPGPKVLPFARPKRAFNILVKNKPEVGKSPMRSNLRGDSRPRHEVAAPGTRSKSFAFGPSKKGVQHSCKKLEQQSREIPYAL